MLTHPNRRNTTLFSCLVNGLRFKTTRKILYLMLLILMLIIFESFVIMQYGWREAAGQSPLTVMFLGIASVQVYDYLSVMRKNIHR
ncbi:MAG: hypothetical protein HQK91_04700 [Nitrospirae bacterium]|nr:hypothetical protein [Nitrospirota bacterium]MBF0540733.1 hypothetical protein [Nitrospirota bacterium]